MEKDYLVEQVGQEYEQFFMSIKCCSKADIFSRSREIERRKRLCSYLKAWLPLQDKKTRKLFEYMDNILEEMDRYASDHEEATVEESVNGYVSDYKNAEDI